MNGLDLPNTLTEKELAELVLKTCYQIPQRARLAGKPLFPYFRVGKRVLYSRDVVLDIISKGNGGNAKRAKTGSAA